MNVLSKVWNGEKFVTKRHYNRTLRRPYQKFQKEISKIQNKALVSDTCLSPPNEVLQTNNVVIEDNYDELFDFELAVNNSFVDEPFNYNEEDILDINELATKLVQESIHNEKTLEERIKGWVLSYGISHDAGTELLKILHPKHPELPLRINTLLKTLRKVQVEPLAPGFYHYIGIANQLEKFVQRGFEPSNKIFELSVNIDGLPLFKSSKKGFWPILGSVNDKVFLIAAYFGPHKPENPNEFLQDFVHECKSLIKGKLLINGHLYGVKLHQIMADLPAKSYIMGIKGHSGYHSCTKCTTEGEYIGKRVCFPQIDARLRTAADFIEQTDSDHHKNNTILVELPGFDIIKQIPIDYMHAICLGVTKKLITLWLSGPKKNKIDAKSIKKISDDLEELSKFCPSDFQRKPRSISDYKLWKSVEFRQFLLYTGPFVLKNVFKSRPDIYNHFMLLHAAVRILSNQKMLNEENINFAEKLLHKFVINFGKIYGKEFISMNVHVLIHLADDVRTYGPLDNFSCFKFENYLFKIKNLIRSGHKPLHQLISRYNEINDFELDSIAVNRTVKHQIKVDGLLISLKKNNKFVQVMSGEVVEITRFLENGSIKGRPFLTKTNFYKKPFLSGNVGVFLLDKLSMEQQIYGAAEITHKLYVAPYKSTIMMGVHLLH